MRLQKLEKPRLAELFSIIEDVRWHHELLFRGQGNSKWGLLPSLYRLDLNHIINKSLKESFDVFEQNLLDEFFRKSHSYRSDLNRGYWEDRVLAQHYGVPTRLLDWTLDPLIALFFAVADFNSETDAAIFFVAPRGKFPPVSAADLGKLGNALVAVQPTLIESRLAMQKSVLSWSNYGEPDKPFVSLDQRTGVANTISSSEGGRLPVFGKIEIPFGHKEELLARLLRIGIDNSAIFPGLDGVGSDVAQRTLFNHSSLSGRHILSWDD